MWGLLRHAPRACRIAPQFFASDLKVRNALLGGVLNELLARLDLDGEFVPMYFTEENHGKLALNDRVIDAVDEILRIGTTFGLSKDPHAPVHRVSPEEKLDG